MKVAIGGMNGRTLRAEFLSLVQQVYEATKRTPDADKSTRLQGFWTMRDSNGETIAEISRDGSTMNVFTEEALPPFGMLDRIADLRRQGYSTAAILEYFGTNVKRDPVRDARQAFAIARMHQRTARQ